MKISLFFVCLMGFLAGSSATCVFPYNWSGSACNASNPCPGPAACMCHGSGGCAQTDYRCWFANCQFYQLCSGNENCCTGFSRALNMGLDVQTMSALSCNSSLCQHDWPNDCSHCSWLYKSSTDELVAKCDYGYVVDGIGIYAVGDNCHHNCILDTSTPS